MQVSKAPIARKAEQGKKKKSKETMTELELLQWEETSLVTSINTTRNKLQDIELALKCGYPKELKFKVSFLLLIALK